jgi:hypothetical protein
MTEATSKPRLTLGLKAVPLKLEAFKARIGLVEPAAAIVSVLVSKKADLGSPREATRTAPQAIQASEPSKAAAPPQPSASLAASRGGIKVAELATPAVVSAPGGACPGNIPATLTPDTMVEIAIAAAAPRKPKRWPANVSAMAWPAKADMLPAILLDGEPVASATDYLDAKKAEGAAAFWARKIAFAVAQNFPEEPLHPAVAEDAQTIREAAELFAMRHRLTCVAAFHKRLPRSLVAERLAELFRSQMDKSQSQTPTPLVSDESR